MYDLVPKLDVQLGLEPLLRRLGHDPGLGVRAARRRVLDDDGVAERREQQCVEIASFLYRV